MSEWSVSVYMQYIHCHPQPVKVSHARRCKVVVQIDCTTWSEITHVVVKIVENGSPSHLRHEQIDWVKGGNMRKHRPTALWSTGSKKGGIWVSYSVVIHLTLQVLFHPRREQIRGPLRIMQSLICKEHGWKEGRVHGRVCAKEG
jgi:hypothetical protein